MDGSPRGRAELPEAVEFVARQVQVEASELGSLPEGAPGRLRLVLLAALPHTREREIADP
jgi:hypothetical protein